MTSKYATENNCVYGKSCKKFGCKKFHPFGRKVGKDCRYGAECRGKDTYCPFHHPPEQEEEPKVEELDDDNIKMLFEDYEAYPPLTKEPPKNVVVPYIKPATSPAKVQENPANFAKKKPTYWRKAEMYNERLWIYINAQGYTYKMVKHLGGGKDVDLKDNKLYQKLYGRYYRLYCKNKRPTPMPRKSCIDYDELARKEAELCA